MRTLGGCAIGFCLTVALIALGVVLDAVVVVIVGIVAYVIAVFRALDVFSDWIET